MCGIAICQGHIQKGRTLPEYAYRREQGFGAERYILCEDRRQATATAQELARPIE